MTIVPRWFRKAFCFPCQVRTHRLKTALADSRSALEKRQLATRSLKEYVDERSAFQQAHN